MRFSAKPSRTSSWASVARTTPTLRLAWRSTARFQTGKSSTPFALLWDRSASTTVISRPSRALTPPWSAGRRWPSRQRYVSHGHDRAHRLQHGLWLHAAKQPASLSLDELALPGRHHSRLAAGRKLHH